MGLNHIVASIHRLPGANRLIAQLLDIFPSLQKPRTVRVLTGPIRGALLRIDPRTQKRCWLGTTEFEMQQWLQRVLRSGDIAYDLGANMGYFTLCLSRLCGSSGQVFAFEPDPANFQRLRQHIGINGITNVKAFRLAVSDVNGPLLFVSGLDIASYVAGLKDTTDSGSLIEVPSVTLDSFVYDAGNPPPHLIKIDVEGFESQVLAGANRILSQSRPFIVCETHGIEQASKVKQCLLAHGYTMQNGGDKVFGWHARGNKSVKVLHSNVMERVCSRDTNGEPPRSVE